MISISYTITPTITDHLVAIDTLRRSILTTPLQLSTERKLHWSALIGHISGSLALSDTPITKSHIAEFLIHPIKRPAPNEQTALSIRDALNWVNQIWYGNPKPVTYQVAVSLVDTLNLGRAANNFLRDEETNVRHLLTYLQSQAEHPIIASALILGEITSSNHNDPVSGVISRLLGALILAKYGYDCHGMIAIEPYLAETIERYNSATESITRLGQLTGWLEYYTAVAESAYESLSESILHASDELTELPASSWQLTNREEQILRRLESPTSKITNRDVQKQFRMSQVTASRDLSKLVSLGLLYTHGKGRSVYYTRA